MPWQQEFKVAGSYSLPFGMDFGAVLQSYRAGTSHHMGAAGGPVRGQDECRDDPADRAGRAMPGAVYPTRRQLQEELPRGIEAVSVQFDLFNALNGNAIFATNNAIGGSLGQVQTILMGRLPRIAFQFLW
jgi:hypothetical protein